MTKKFLAVTALVMMGPGVAGADGHSGLRGVASPIGDLPHATAGQCFARIVTPAQYEKVPETVVVQEGYKTQHAVEAQLRASSTEVMVKEAGVKYVVRQPRYETQQETVMVRPGYERLVVEPARYETVTETITIGERRYEWKKGENLSDTKRYDAKTGEVYCLVEIPAKTTTVSKRVLVAPENVKRVAVEPEYTTVTKQVLVDRGGVDEVPVPPQYKTIATQEIAAPARIETRDHAAVTKQVDRIELRAPERYDWVEVLCDTNATTSNISALQRALADRGFYKGKVDGIMGPQTQSAVDAYQRSIGETPSGYVTMKTLQSLGLSAPGVSRHPTTTRKPVKAPVNPSVMPQSTPSRLDFGSEAIPTRGLPNVTNSQSVARPAPMTTPNAPKTVSADLEGQVLPLERQNDAVYGASSEEVASQALQEANSSEERREYSVRRRLNWEGK